MKRRCKKHKNTLLKVFLATAVLGGTFAVFSSDLEVYSAVGKSTVKGRGSVEGLALSDVFNVVLPAVPENVVDQNKPVSNVYDFILDPKGLAPGKYPGSFQPGKTLYFKNTADGAPYDYSNTSDALSIENKSTIDVDVKLNASIKGVEGVTLINDSTFADDKNASVFLALTDSNGKVSAVDKYGAFLRTTLTGKPEAYKPTYDSAASRYKYELKSDAELSAENIIFDEYSFQLTGDCNTANEWLNMPEPIMPSITTTWSVAPRPDNLAASIGKKSYTMNKNRPNDVDVDLGAGTLAASSISSITFKDVSGAVVTLNPSNYSFAVDTLTFNAAYITSLIEAGVKSRAHTINFDDAAVTQVNVTLKVNDIAPSIEVTSYTVTGSQPILIDIDMGSGSLGATGISSITFTNAAGNTVTVAAKNYAIANGTLELKTTLIDNLLKSGDGTRDYVITLNDKAATQFTVTLTAEGSAPSITNTSYTMQKDQPVSIDVDLGAGSLGATGIQSLTFTTKAGAVKNVPVDEYALNGSVLTINASHITACINGGNVSRTYTVTFNDAAATKVNVVLTAADVPPSITQTSYTMTYGQPVSIDIDMGSGVLGATGIASIKFVNTSGSTVTMSTDRYTYANGTLVFSDSAVNGIYNNGLASRTYTITLNDQAATQFNVTLSAGGTQPSVVPDSYTMRRGEPLLIDVDLGTGELEATDITSLTFINKTGGIGTVAADRYTFDGRTLTISALHVDACINAGNVSRTFIITFNDLAKTKVSVVVNAIEKAPSLDQTSCSMTNGQPVIVGVDLGSGNLGALGIRSITYVDDDGKVNTVAVDKYILTEEGLKFKAAIINGLFADSIASRSYTVTFDDKNATQQTVTLAADGRFPSISTTTYTMYRDQPLTIGVDLGSGSLGATGIQTLNFINKTGGVGTVAANLYKLNGNNLTIDVSHINACINNGNISRTYMITFNNPSKTKINVIVNAANVAPSVSQTSYIMREGQPVAVSIGLGSGVSGATGIKSITFVNKAGAVATLASGNYSFSNTSGVLTLNATHINNMYNNGIMSRAYTITMNNTAATKLTVTLIR